MTDPWIVFQEGSRRRWGGDLRRAFIFAALAERTAATIIDGFQPGAVSSALDRVARRRFGVLRGRRPMIASSENLSWVSLGDLRSRARPVVLDVHDDPVAQLRSFGMSADPALLEELGRRMRTNLAAFPLLVVPSETFGDLAGIDPTRRIVACNGTDSGHIRPQPLPDEPTIGFISGAAAGRGIETLVDAARLVRTEIADLRLRLWLTATGDASAAYLDDLRARLASDPWIAVAAARYDELSGTLAQATILTVPHPPDPYMDSAVPVKLFDSMAAGRPVVVTPRTEMAAIVRRHSAGLVAESDRPVDLAEAMARLLRDPVEAGRLGSAARQAAVTDYDWGVIGGRVADAVLARAT